MIGAWAFCLRSKRSGVRISPGAPDFKQLAAADTRPPAPPSSTDLLSGDFRFRVPSLRSGSFTSCFSPSNEVEKCVVHQYAGVRRPSGDCGPDDGYRTGVAASETDLALLTGSTPAPISRRGFLAALLAAFVADPDKLLWVPGRKDISIPKPTVAIDPGRDEGTVWIMVCNPTPEPDWVRERFLHPVCFADAYLNRWPETEAAL